MNISKKKELVDFYTKKLTTDKNFIVFDYGSLTSNESCGLRKNIHKQQSYLSVVRNDILRRAWIKAGLEMSGQIFNGASAILFVGDNLASIKEITNLYSLNKNVSVKSACLEGTFLNDEQISTISSLKLKTDLLLDIIRILQCPLYKLLFLLKNLGGE